MKLNKAIFLDRDGTINNDEGHYYVFREEDFRFNEGVFPKLRAAQKEGYLLILITNQGGIAKGEYTKAAVERLHQYMLFEFEKEGVFFDAIYLCPHHTSVSKCLCRKPEALMLEKAIARFNIDPAQSFFVGDSKRDVLAAQKVGIRAIHIPVNQFEFILK